MRHADADGPSVRDTDAELDVDGVLDALLPALGDKLTDGVADAAREVDSEVEAHAEGASVCDARLLDDGDTDSESDAVA